MGMMVGASCIDRPDYVLDEDQMIDLLVDVHKAEGLIEMQASSNNDQDYQKSIMAAVLVEHGVSRAQYDSSLMWYARHLKQLVRVYSHVDERLLDEHDMWSTLTTDNRDFMTSEPGDSIQLWSMRDYLVLDHCRFTDRRFWELESDSNFYKGDTLRWTFDVNHLVDGQQVFASIVFTRDEKDMSNSLTIGETNRLKTLPIGQCSNLIAANGSQELTAVPDTLTRFAKAYLSISLIATDSVAQCLPVFLNNISLMRYHCE